MTPQRTPIPCVTALLFLWGFCLAIVSMPANAWPPNANALEISLRAIPLGSTGAAASKIIGRPPNETTIVRGVLSTSVTLLLEENELASHTGKIKQYRLLIWRTQSLTAVVCLSMDDAVCGRWIMRHGRAGRRSFAM